MYKKAKHLILTAATLLSAFSQSQRAWAQDATTPKRYLITNNNSSPTNTATFYEIVGTPTAPTLQSVTTAGTGGSGSATALNKAAKLVIVTKVAGEACAYVANIASNNITGFLIPRQQYAGIFSGSTMDVGLRGLASNGIYLYANFSSADSIATFQTTAGCGLSFLGDISTKGGGSVSDMALHGNIMVVTFGDGYIESFNIASGLPVSNGDLQPPAGQSQGLYPNGVDISKNGNYAVFGDTGGSTAVEVSDISSGKLTPPRLYDNLGAGLDSTSIMLSPSDALLYITDTRSVIVTVARFNQTTGVASLGCVSGALIGPYVVPGNFALETTSGTGDVVFIAQSDGDNGGVNSIGALGVDVTSSTCQLPNAAGFPFSVSGAVSLQSIAAYPPRPF